MIASRTLMTTGADRDDNRVLNTPSQLSKRGSVAFQRVAGDENLSFRLLERGVADVYLGQNRDSHDQIGGRVSQEAGQPFRRLLLNGMQGV